MSSEDLGEYTESGGEEGALEGGMREAVHHPGIDGTWHHHGSLEWWEPEQLYGSDYARPICPVKHCATGEDHECRTICRRINVDEQIKPEFIDVDRPVGGAWFCVCHGWFRVYGHPRETVATSEQATLVADGGNKLDDCPQCGGETVLVEGTWRSCTDCEWYERWDRDDEQGDDDRDVVELPEQHDLDGERVGQARLSFD